MSIIYPVLIRWAAAICRLCRGLLSTPGSTVPAQQMETDQRPAEDDKHEQETTSASPSPSNEYTKSETVSRSKNLKRVRLALFLLYPLQFELDW